MVQGLGIIFQVGLTICWMELWSPLRPGTTPVFRREWAILITPCSIAIHILTPQIQRKQNAMVCGYGVAVLGICRLAHKQTHFSTIMGIATQMVSGVPHIQPVISSFAYPKPKPLCSHALKVRLRRPAQRQSRAVRRWLATTPASTPMESMYTADAPATAPSPRLLDPRQSTTVRSLCQHRLGSTWGLPVHQSAESRFGRVRSHATDRVALILFQVVTPPELKHCPMALQASVAAHSAPMSR